MAHKISKSLILGVGGTGQRVIVNLIKKLHENFGEVPEIISYLSIDADQIKENEQSFEYEYEGQNFKKDILIETQNQFYFGKVNLKNQYEEVPPYKLFTPKNYQQYAPDSTKGKGAKGVRLVGKMLVSSKYPQVKETIANKIREVIEKQSTKYTVNDNETIRIFIVGSFAGGAGSGMFIDIANIVYSTNVLKDENIELVGFFAMPSFFKSLPSTQNIIANTYGAFHELDYLQDPASDYGKLVNSFDNQSITTKRFDAIYIMDNILSNSTLIDKETMESATASAIANLVSAIGDEMDSMSVNNPQFDKFTMGKKRRGYSGFGICELTLKRNELKKFVEWKIILNALNEYRSNNYEKNEFDTRRDEFITTHKLDEGVGKQATEVNELTNSIFTLDDSELEVYFALPEPGDNVIEELKTSYAIYKKDLKQKAQNLILSYENKVFNDHIDEDGNNNKGVKSSLILLLENLLYSNGGMSRTKLFAGSFVNHLSEMKKELAKEISSHEDQMDEIESVRLISLNDDIIEKQKGVFSIFKKNQIRDIIENYSFIISHENEVDNIRYHFLQIIRKKGAINIYDKLINICKEYYYNEMDVPIGRVAIYESDINNAIDKLGMSIRQYVEANKKPFSKINIKLNHFFVKIIEENEFFNKIVKHYNIDVPSFIKSTKNTNNLIQKLIVKLQESIGEDDTLLSKLSDHNYPVEELIKKYSSQNLRIGDEKGGYTDLNFKDYLIREINNNLPRMWRYNPMNVPYDQDNGTSTCLPELYFVVGNHNGQKGYIIEEIIGKLAMQGTIGFKAVNAVSSNNPNVISLYVQEHAVPAFMIHGLDMCYSEFKQLSGSGTFYFYTDKRFEKHAPDIFPIKSNEKALRLWVKGFFTDLIYNKNQGYYIKSSSGSKGTDVKCYDDSSNKGKNDRCNAFEYFSESEIFPSEINQKFERMLSRDQEKLRKDLLDYFHNEMYTRKSIGKFEKSLEDNEKELLFKEERMLIQIGLDELNMHSRDFIKPGLEGNELEEYKYYLQDLGAEEVF